MIEAISDMEAGAVSSAASDRSDINELPQLANPQVARLAGTSITRMDRRLAVSVRKYSLEPLRDAFKQPVVLHSVQ